MAISKTKGNIGPIFFYINDVSINEIRSLDSHKNMNMSGGFYVQLFINEIL